MLIFFQFKEFQYVEHIQFNNNLLVGVCLCAIALLIYNINGQLETKQWKYYIILITVNISKSNMQPCFNIQLSN